MSVLHIGSKSTIVRHAHPMVEAVKAIMVHLISITAMLNKGLSE